MLEIAPSLLNLALGRYDICLRMHHCSIDLGDLSVGGFERGFLLGIVKLEQGRTLSHVAAKSYVDLRRRDRLFREEWGSCEKRR